MRLRGRTQPFIAALPSARRPAKAAAPLALRRNVTNQISTVPFYGEHLDAIQDDKGTVWVSLLRCCENLGLAPDTQSRKLKGKVWATTTEMMVDSPDNSKRVVTCIDLDSLPGWLFSINARKVKESIREKVIRYQKECARVLRDHFFSSRDRIAKLEAEIAHLRSQLDAPRLLPVASTSVDRYQLAYRTQQAVREEVASFVRERTTKSEGRILARCVYVEYGAWMGSRDQKPLGKIRFYKYLREQGITIAPGQSNATTCFGIGLTV